MSTAIASSIVTQGIAGNATVLVNSCIASGILAPGGNNEAAIWEALVTPSEAGPPYTTRVRFDGSQEDLPTPHVLSLWQADIGWHRPISDLYSAVSDDALISSSVEGSETPLPGGQTSIDHNSELATTPEFADLVAEIAHDIRSPIAVANQIVGAVSEQARTTGSLSSGELELLDVASMRLLEANRWAEGILVGRCLEHGTPINIRRRFYPSQWRSVVEPLLRGIAAKRRVHLEWVGWDRSLPRLYLDENQLTRAVQNLVSNAIQASPIGGKVEVRVTTQNNVTQRLILAIEDEGPGLEPSLMRQLNSHSPSRNEKAELLGSGLGLSTCKSLVAALGGELHASHSPSGGTQVRISLPTDDPQSLLRSWLVDDMQARAAARDYGPSEVQLFAIRSSGLNQQFVDTQLQQSTSQHDFVYRVSQDRWLWFTIAPTKDNSSMSDSLSAALGRLRSMRNGTDSQSLCQSQLVYRVHGIIADKPEQLHTRLTEVAHQLTVQIERLMGGRVPNVDDIGLHPGSIVFRTHGNNTTRQVRQDMPHHPVAPKMHRRPARRGSEAAGRNSNNDIRVDTHGGLPTPAASKADSASRGSAQGPGIPLGSTPQPETESAGNTQTALAQKTSPAATVVEGAPLAESITLQRAIAEVANVWQADLATMKHTHQPLINDIPPK